MGFLCEKIQDNSPELDEIQFVHTQRRDSQNISLKLAAKMQRQQNIPVCYRKLLLHLSGTRTEFGKPIEISSDSEINYILAVLNQVRQAKRS